MWSFLRNHAGNAFCPLTSAQLTGRTIAVDAGMLFTTALKVSVTDEPEIVWRPVFINMVMRKIKWLTDAGATPVIVLDGTAPEVKKHAHDKRAAARAAAFEKLELARIANNKVDIVKALRNSSRLTPDLEAAAADTLKDAGIEVIRAPGEAEVECARMSLENQVWGVATEDGDALICGARRVIRGICSACANGGSVIDRDLILRTIELTPEQFRWMAVLSGTDFHPGVKGVGCARAVKAVKPYPVPGDVIQEIVKDESIHEGLFIAVEQFGKWSTENAHVATEVADENTPEDVKVADEKTSEDVKVTEEKSNTTEDVEVAEEKTSEDVNAAEDNRNTSEDIEEENTPEDVKVEEEKRNTTDDAEALEDKNTSQAKVAAKRNMTEDCETAEDMDTTEEKKEYAHTRKKMRTVDGVVPNCSPSEVWIEDIL